jgi:hypothetical protein
MSRVYFHSPSGDAELHGSERAWLGGLVNDIALGVLSPSSPSRVDRLRPFIHPDHYLAATDPYAVDAYGRGGLESWASTYATAFSVGWSHRAPLIQYRGKALDSFTLSLNTAALLGNDQIKLAARLHGQCELHAWVDGPNRVWLAEIMQTGLDSGIYRRGFQHEADPSRGQPDPRWVSQGWDEVIALLRQRDDEPVVTSYSVCDQFPNSSVGDWMPPWPEGLPREWDALSEKQQEQRSARSDKWYELDDAEQWRISMAGLCASSDGLEMKPDNWSSFRFEHKLSVLDLLAPDADDRLVSALDMEPVA